MNKMYDELYSMRLAVVYPSSYHPCDSDVALFKEDVSRSMCQVFHSEVVHFDYILVVSDFGPFHEVMIDVVAHCLTNAQYHDYQHNQKLSNHNMPTNLAIHIDHEHTNYLHHDVHHIEHQHDHEMEAKQHLLEQALVNVLDCQMIALHHFSIERFPSIPAHNGCDILFEEAN